MITLMLGVAADGRPASSPIDERLLDTGNFPLFGHLANEI
jgi:hypothetical protein